MKAKSLMQAAFLAAAVFLSACSTLRPPTTDALLTDDYTLVKEYMRKYIAKTMQRERITGLSVALVDGDNIVWSEGFGFSDKALEAQATADTQYRAGSVSKLFTAISVMQLVEKGQIDIDKPLRDYVPEFNINSRFGSIDEITLRNTLAHHSGIPDSYVDGLFSNKTDSFKKVATHLHDYYTAFAPNTVFSYSNSGFALAGHAVENVSGEPYVEYQQAHLLDKLGMTNSNFEMDVSGSLVSKSYLDGAQVEELSLRDLPAGGLISDVTDLSKLVVELHGIDENKTKLLKASTYKEMLELQEFTSAYALTPRMGLGFMHQVNMLQVPSDIIGHGGDTMAHSAFLVSVPEWKLGVVLLANSPNSGTLQKIAAELLKVSYPVKAQQALVTADAPAKDALPGIETSFDGRYTSGFGDIFIEGSSGSYKVEVDGQKYALAPNDAGEYKVKVKLLGLIPISIDELSRVTFHAREVDGAKIIIADERRARDVIASEVQLQKINEAWHDRIGEYAIENPIETSIDLFKVESMSVGYDDGVYYVEARTGRGTQRVPLTIVNDTEAISQGVGRGLGETLIARADGTLVSSGIRLSRNDQ